MSSRAGIAIAIVVIASLATGACGKDSPPKAFPGAATDKARELVRREDARGLRLGTESTAQAVRSTAAAYGTVGDGFCVEERPELRKSLGVAGGTPAERALDLQRANLIVDIYCPWLPHFQSAD